MKLQITTVVVFPVLFPAMFPSFPNSNPLIREPAIVLRLLFLKFVWMLRVKSKQQNTRPNRTYFSNDKNSWKMHGILLLCRLAHKSTIIEFATVTQHGDRGWNRMYVPAINGLLYQPLHYPPSPWKVVPHHRSRPLLLWVLLRPHKNQNSERAVRRRGLRIFVHFQED